MAKVFCRLVRQFSPIGFRNRGFALDQCRFRDYPPSLVARAIKPKCWKRLSPWQRTECWGSGRPTELSADLKTGAMLLADLG
jgi:hypothetical protein